MKINRKRMLALLAAAVWMMSAALAENEGAEGLPAGNAETGAPAAQSGNPEEEILSARADWMEDRGLSLGKSRVTYPALRDGILDAERTAKINEQIQADGEVRAYLTRMSQLISEGGMTVSWRGSWMGPVFSFALAAEGTVTSPRNTWVWTSGSLDLRDGHEIAPEEIFSDPDGARREMEDWLETEIVPDLSAHLANSQATPLPDRFWMTERGLVFLYPIEALSTLSDRAGSLLVPWNAAEGHLRLEAGSLLDAMGVRNLLTKTEDLTEDGAEERKQALEKIIAEGRIPGIPAGLGDGMQELTDARRMLTDPDVYARGRIFALEGAEFQGVFLLTDFLSESWENSVVDGIRVDQGTVCGLILGETRQEEWRKLLGEPAHAIEMDGEEAEAWRTVPGVRDYYEFGGHRLQLQADEEGTLASLILSE